MDGGAAARARARRHDRPAPTCCACRAGLTSEMIAACAKLMSNLDLVVAARKIRVVVHANNTSGCRGGSSVRLQPNHPSDSIEGILASLQRRALATARRRGHRHQPGHRRRRARRAAILERHAPLHRRVAHPDAELLPGARHHADEGARGGRAAGPDVPVDRRHREGAAQLRRHAAAARRGVGHDAEARAGDRAERHVLRDRPGLGAVGRRAPRRRSADAGGAQLRPRAPLSRRSWSTPWSASSARSTCTTRGRSRAPGLEDHFMGKLHGISMGCDACYTNHADADQNDLENLEVLLTTAGLQLLHGAADGRRRHAQLPVDVVPRRRDAARSCSASARRPSSRRGWRRWGSCATAS